MNRQYTQKELHEKLCIVEASSHVMHVSRSYAWYRLLAIWGIVWFVSYGALWFGQVVRSWQILSLWTSGVVVAGAIGATLYIGRGQCSVVWGSGRVVDVRLLRFWGAVVCGLSIVPALLYVLGLDMVVICFLIQPLMVSWLTGAVFVAVGVRYRHASEIWSGITMLVIGAAAISMALPDRLLWLAVVGGGSMCVSALRWRYTAQKGRLINA